MKTTLENKRNSRKLTTLGFTLIELLAVIVILAIIALIATPIVLNIINETKESATLRSAEFYMDAVENSIAMGILNNQTVSDGPYNITKDGDICLANFDSANKTCPDTNTLKVEVSGEKPSSGSIYIENGTIKDVEIKIDSNDKTIVKNEKGELVYQTSICTYVNNGVAEKTPGAKYTCKVDPNKEAYTFYVLSEGPNGTTNLIMDRNINSDGTPVTKAINESEKNSNSGIYNLVAWNSSGSNAGGPVDAMNYLNDATSEWTNLKNLNITYDDEGNHFTDFPITGKARLPRYDEVHGTGKCLTYSENGNKYGSCPLYLANYLGSSSYVTGEGLVNIEGIYGYWTLSSSAGFPYYAWYVYSGGSVGSTTVGSDDYSGVRPVINLKL